MTTGRINQVTIVRRGWPCGSAVAPPQRLSKLLVVGPSLGRAARRARRSEPLQAPLAAFRFPPLRSPGRLPLALGAVAAPPVGCGRSAGVAWAPQEEDSPRRVSHFGVGGAWLPPAALRCSASQWPCTHRTHQRAATGASPRRRSGIPGWT